MGIVDSRNVESWIREFEKLFDTLKGGEDSQVGYTAMLLEGLTGSRTTIQPFLLHGNGTVR